MSSMDSPHRQRPLAGVDQALGEGRARQPTELLDQLRERLSRLDANHPSAPPRRADHPVADVGEEPSAGSEAEPTSSPDEALAQADLREIADAAPRDPGRASVSGAKDAGSSAGKPSSAGPENASDSVSAQDQEPFEASPAGWRRPAAGNPYRPWFAADEPITPWFAE